MGFIFDFMSSMVSLVRVGSFNLKYIAGYENIFQNKHSKIYLLEIILE